MSRVPPEDRIRTLASECPCRTRTNRVFFSPTAQWWLCYNCGLKREAFDAILYEVEEELRAEREAAQVRAEHRAAQTHAEREAAE